MSFARFELLPQLNESIAAMGFVEPTPIQCQAVPAVLEGWDVLGSAQTGSGKTVAFTLPMLQRLLEWRRDEGPGGIRAMILTPTRELAAQVEQCVADLSRGAVKTALIIGGEAYGGQLKALKAGAEVVVATPGRLLDHQGSGALSLKGVRFAVLDEADRMLDMGFIPDIRRIMGNLPLKRQTLMFSATMPPEIERLVREFMKDPFRCQVDRPTKPAASIRQAIYPITEDQKLELLLAMISKLDMKSAVVFTRTKQRAERVGKFLEARGVNAASLHSDLSQAQRTKTMDAFRDKKVQVLVATDLASRGLDVPHVTHVVNFDAPSHPEDYVHRIGRTGRAFSAGDAVMLMSFEDQKPVNAVEAYIGETIPRLALEGFPYRVPPRLVAYKPPLSANFRLRRVIPRGSGARFRR